MQFESKFDIIVIGVGSMGSSTCYHLAKQGLKVLGLEQFDIPNELSSHTGQSRIIRKAYFEHPDYVPLLERAYQNWDALEKESGVQIYFKTGLLYSGRADHMMITGVKASAKAYHVPLDVLLRAEVEKQYPQLHVPEGYETLFEPDAGFVSPEKAITSFVELAKRYGAVIKSNIKVQSWKKINTGFEVITTAGTYAADKLIFTSGPWAGKLIPQLTSTLRVTRQVLAWVTPKQISSFEMGNFPCWLIADEYKPGVFYGFPVLNKEIIDGPVGFKLALHYPGDTTNPDHVNRTPILQDEQLLVDFLDRFFPKAYVSTEVMKTCLYTNTPDEHFILDFLPGYEKDVMIAAGFSGHGFKFASVIGEIMGEMAVKGKTELPITFLQLDRFA